MSPISPKSQGEFLPYQFFLLKRAVYSVLSLFFCKNFLHTLWFLWSFCTILAGNIHLVIFSPCPLKIYQSSTGNGYKSILLKYAWRNLLKSKKLCLAASLHHLFTIGKERTIQQHNVLKSFQKAYFKYPISSSDFWTKWLEDGGICLGSFMISTGSALPLRSA